VDNPKDTILALQQAAAKAFGSTYAGTYTAMELLQGGVDHSPITLWLGHERVETTQIYLEATLAMKEKALAKTSPPHGRRGCYKPGDRLLAFLSDL
jgi:hypothetical protein